MAGGIYSAGLDSASELLAAPVSPRARVAGVTLIELIVTLVIVGAALAGMVAVFASTTRASVDPVVVQQMQAIAAPSRTVPTPDPRRAGPASGGATRSNLP